MCCQQIVKILFAAICLQLLPSPTHKYIHKQCHHYFPSTMAFEYYQYCKICGAWRRKVILHESIKRIATIFARDSQWKSNKMFGLTIVYIACTSTRSRIFNASRSRLVYGTSLLCSNLFKRILSFVSLTPAIENGADRTMKMPFYTLPFDECCVHIYSVSCERQAICHDVFAIDMRRGTHIQHF